MSTHMGFRQYISLLDMMARLSLRAEARSYFLSYLWWILEPLLWVGVFYLVFDVLLKTRTPDFLLFLMVGKLMFIWFSKTVNYAGRSLLGNQGLIGRMALPKSLFPMVTILECTYRQLVVIALLFALLVFNLIEPTALWWWFLPLVFAQGLLIVVCSLVAAVLVAIKRDFGLLINLGLVFLMFMSGVFWDLRQIPNAEAVEFLLTWNPIAFLLHSYRQILLWGESPDIVHLSVLTFVLSLLVVSLLGLYRKYSTHIARLVVIA